MLSARVAHAPSPLRKHFIPAVTAAVVLVLAACDGGSGPAVAPAPTSSPVSGDVSATPLATPTPESPDVDRIYADLARELIDNPEQLYTYYADYYQHSTGREYHLDGTNPDGNGYSYPSIAGTSGAGSWRFWRDASKEQWGQLMTYHWVKPGTPEQSILIVTMPPDIPDAAQYAAGGGFPHHAWFAVDGKTMRPYMLRVSNGEPSVVDGNVIIAELVGSAGDSCQMEEFTYDPAAGRFTSQMQQTEIKRDVPQRSEDITWTTSTGTTVSLGQLNAVTTPSGMALSELAR